MANFSYFLITLLFCSTLTFITCQNEVSDKYTCSASELDKLDQISARILSLSEHQRRFPESIAHIPRYCKATKDDLALVTSQSNKCLMGTSKQFSSVIIYSVKASMKQYCNMRNKRRLRESMVIGRCMNRNLKQSNTCLAKYIDALQRGKRAEPRENRIGYACCDYFKLIGCLEGVTRSTCSPKQADLIGDFIRNLFDGVVSISCGDYQDNSDTCDHLPEAPMKHWSDKPVRTFTLPLVELWNHL